MSELTKKPHTEELHYRIPAGRREEAIKYLDSLQGELIQVAEDKECPAWMEYFPEAKDNVQGVTLRGSRTKEGLRQVELAKRTGIPQRHISEMENGKRPIGKKHAKTLATVLKMDYRLFM